MAVTKRIHDRLPLTQPHTCPVPLNLRKVAVHHELG